MGVCSIPLAVATVLLGSANYLCAHAKWIATEMGAFERPIGTRLAKHIFAAAKGDDYGIPDGLPQNAQ